MVENFQIKELRKLVQLLQSVFPHDFQYNEPTSLVQKAYRDDAGIYIIKNQSDDIVAAVIATFDGDRGWIYSLAVHENYRLMNYARKLVHHAMMQLKLLGCDKVNLQVQKSNKELADSYKKTGFSIEDHISMEKFLVYGSA